jgi:hypothetical protein
MKIRVNEFKYKLVNGVNDLIDTYFYGGGIKERFINATVKIIVSQNVDKIDDFIFLFTDKDGFIDTEILIKEYGKAFGTDKLILDLRDFIENDSIKQILPNKALAIQIEDLANIFEKR